LDIFNLVRLEIILDFRLLLAESHFLRFRFDIFCTACTAGWTAQRGWPLFFKFNNLQYLGSL